MRSRVCSFQFLLGIARAAFLRSESHGAYEHILLSLFLRLPNLEGQVPVFISPRNRVAHLYPRALRHSRITADPHYIASSRTAKGTHPLLLYPVNELVSVWASIIVISNCCRFTYPFPSRGCSVVSDLAFLA
jgi:hypothetical protein